jgi:hypothetical protein
MLLWADIAIVYGMYKINSTTTEMLLWADIAIVYGMYKINSTTTEMLPGSCGLK